MPVRFTLGGDAPLSESAYSTQTTPEPKLGCSQSGAITLAPGDETLPLHNSHEGNERMNYEEKYYECYPSH